MCAEQFDENKESVRYVCRSGGGYAWGYIYYDSETGKWYEHSYHCGSIDLAEDYDDGVSAIEDKKYVLITLIEKNAKTPTSKRPTRILPTLYLPIYSFLDLPLLLSFAKFVTLIFFTVRFLNHFLNIII